MKITKIYLPILALALTFFSSAYSQVLNNQYEIAAFPQMDTLTTPAKPAGPDWMNKFPPLSLYSTPP